jgi:hypothetical protein
MADEDAMNTMDAMGLLDEEEPTGAADLFAEGAAPEPVAVSKGVVAAGPWLRVVRHRYDGHKLVLQLEVQGSGRWQPGTVRVRVGGAWFFAAVAADETTPAGVHARGTRLRLTLVAAPNATAVELDGVVLELP